MPDDIGPVRGMTDATRAVEGHLRQWLPLYLDRVGAHLNATKPDGDPDVYLRVPRSWRTPVTSAALSLIQDGQLPSVSVVPAGTAQVKRLGQVWQASWLLDVVVFARGQSYDHTAALLGGYLTATHLALAQHRGVGDLDDVHWVGEIIEAIDPQASRTLGQATVTVRASYDAVVDESRYPGEVPDPVSDPVPDWPTVNIPRLSIDRDVSPESS